MKIGKLYIRLEETERLGKHFVLETDNKTHNIFDLEGDNLRLRISIETAIKLIQFVDENTDDFIKENGYPLLDEQPKANEDTTNSEESESVE